MKKQIVIIHGGETFDTYEEYFSFLVNYKIDFANLYKKGWKSTLGEQLGENYEIVAPRMPNAMNANYAEWKVYFEKYIPYIQDGVIFIGHSLGGAFLAKYFAENGFPKDIKATFLVAAPFGNAPSYSLGDFAVPENLSLFAKQSPLTFLFHSEDDPIVPFTELGKYRERLPDAVARSFHDRGHFDQEEFPELVVYIQKLPVRNK